MIRLGLLFPKHLNLNGDSGNLEVLSRQFEWRGHEVELVELHELRDLSQPLHFVLVGHGSEAAWADIRVEFGSMTNDLKTLLDAAVPVLAISTGFEAAIRSGLVTAGPLSALPERISKFSVVETDGQQLLGYVNVDTNLPEFFRQGSFIGTALHGPVLSKNPALLDELLAAIASKAQVKLNPIRDAKKADLLADLIAEVWKLESELANE
jgi:lipid II isoglutaminyl synthase (glutamine-hydrolysing)